MTASSVNLAAVTPIRSKHSATMLSGVVNMLINRSMGVTVPIVPGVLPILSAPQVRRFTALCCAKIPTKLERELVRVEGDENAAIQVGIEYATRQCEDLIKFGVPGLHFYSLNKSHSLLSIVNNLGL